MTLRSDGAALIPGIPSETGQETPPYEEDTPL